MKDGFIAEEEGGGVTHYSLISNGEFLLRLLRNGNVMRSIVRLSGERLRRL